MVDLNDLQDKIGYDFADAELLRQALTHSSFVNEKGLDRFGSNERLEYLGDALLEMAISQMLYRQSPVLSEGEMTKLRARLVCEESLSELAQNLDLGSFLLLAHGEDNGGGRKRPSILADAFEAVIAAIYLDGGIEPTMRFVENAFSPYVNKPVSSSTDYKTLLQEHTQNKQGQSLSYKLVGQHGPDHDKTFTVEVWINREIKGIGIGKSKKSAEQAAAKEAINLLKGE